MTDWQSPAPPPPSPPMTDGGIQHFLHWSIVWGQIADKCLADAETVRATMYAGDPGSEKVELEHQAALVAIAASAFAVEAEVQRVKLPKPATAPSLRDRKLNKGDYYGQALMERGRFTPNQSESLGNVFDLRNESVHPTHGWSDEIPLHPSGFTHVGSQYVAYSLEAAREAVAIAKAAIAAM